MVVAWAWEAEHRGLYKVTECQFPKGKCLGIGCLQSDNGGEVGPGCHITFHTMLPWSDHQAEPLWSKQVGGGLGNPSQSQVMARAVVTRFPSILRF